MPQNHPRPRRGKLEADRLRYGSSVLGAPLLWFPAPNADDASGLILAGTHGDETAAVITLSCHAHAARKASSPSRGAGG